MEPGTFQTVSQLTDSIKFTLNSDFGDVWVVGEVSGLTEPRSGHIYFTLKDSTAQISTIIWRSAAERLRFRPQPGMQLLCRGNIDVYPQRGNYQLIARVIQPIGEGTLQIAFRKLHDRLRNEGYFDDDHKLDLPTFPRRIVVVTSTTGAAIHDFLQVATRRWPHLDIVIAPVRVQGPEAANQIAKSVATFGGGKSRFVPDVIVVTRGGGSIEDLWAFNEEVVVKSIYHANVPVISAVGHEINVSLSDLVADLRALTPSEAAEKLVPNKPEILHMLRSWNARLNSSIQNRYEKAKANVHLLGERRILKQPLESIRQLGLQLDTLESRLVENSKRQFAVTRHRLTHLLDRLRFSIKSTIPRNRAELDSVLRTSSIHKPLLPVLDRRQKLEQLEHRLGNAIKSFCERRKNEIDVTSSKLQAFNPTLVLQRGYTLTVDQKGQPITSCHSIQTGDTIETYLGTGKLTSVVDAVENDAEYLENGQEKNS